MSKDRNERAEQKRGIMKAAWEIAHRTGKSISDALKAAWRAFWLKVKARAGEVCFTYLKKDGSIRSARGTLKPEAIDYTPNGRGRRTPDHLFLYWDLDANAYRTFDRANLLTVAR